MKTLRINPWAILTAAIIGQFIAPAWYTLNAAAWTKFTGIPVEQALNAPASSFIIGAVGTLIQLTFVAVLFRNMRIESLGRGLLLGMGIGFFFDFTDISTINLFAGRPFGLSLIDGVMTIFFYGISGAILGGWRRYESTAPAIDEPARTIQTA